jgi:hypothetical protein
MTESEVKQIEEMATLKQSMNNVAQDVSSIVTQMKILSELQIEITRLQQKDINSTDALRRAFERIEKQEQITGVIKEASEKWVNRGVGAWVVGTVLFTVIQALVIDRVKDYERTQSAQTEILVTIDRRLSWIEYEQKKHSPMGTK